MKIPWTEAHAGLPVPEEQYQERFWRRRLDGIGLDTTAKEFLAIEFKRTQDMKSDYVERATAVAQKQYKSLLAGLQVVRQAKGWKVQQIVFVGGTSGSIHTDSFNSNMKALGVLESKWDSIRQKLVRRLIEEQDKVLRSLWVHAAAGTCIADEHKARGRQRAGATHTGAADAAAADAIHTHTHVHIHTHMGVCVCAYVCLCVCVCVKICGINFDSK